MRLALCGCFSFWMMAGPVRQPLSFVPNRGQVEGPADFIAQAGPQTVFLTGGGLTVAAESGEALRLALVGAQATVSREGLEPRPGASNYLTPGRWAVNVPHFARVRYRGAYAGVDLDYYFNGQDLEHDFVVAPGARWDRIRLRAEGARRLRLDGNGDLVIETASGVLRQKQPVAYQRNRVVEARYAVDGLEYGFAIGEYDPRLPLVIDPVTVFGSYLGGTGVDQPNAVAADAQGNTYVTGNTTSANFPTKGAAQSRYGGNTDIFITKLDSTGAIVYSTYIGGNGSDSAKAIRVDAAGNVYVAGSTRSADFPAVRGLQTALNGPLSAFVLKLNPAGSALVYATYLNGTGKSVARGLDIDAQGNAYVVGATTSNDFPVRATSFGKFFRSAIDGFVTKLSSDGASLVYSGFLAGSGVDYLEAVYVNALGEAVVAGWTTSPDLPSDNEFSRWPRIAGVTNGYFAKISPSGADLTASSYYGGSRNDYLLNVLPDKSDPAVVYFTGLATSPDFPTVDGAPVRAGNVGAVSFAAKFAVPGVNPGARAPVPQTPSRAGGGVVRPDDRYDWFVPIQNDCDGTDWQPIIDDFKKDQQDLREIREFAIASGVGAINGNAGLAVGGLIVAQHLACPAGSKAKEHAASAYGWFYGINLATARELEVPQPPASAIAAVRAVTVDNAGNVYAAMQGTDQQLPVTAGGARPASNGRTGYVTKISSASSSTPTVTAVTNAFGGSTTLAPNTWVVITGTSLAPATTARIWQGSDFVNNQLPTTLDGTSVRLNGLNAYVWYASPTQLNVLTPPNLPSGPVQVTVTAGGATSAAFNVQAQATSLSLFVFGAGPYATSTHASGAYLGPSSLYPGLTTPAQPGESIILYGNGFGATSVPVVPGAASQSGTLSPLPVIQIGGVNATVQFAGLVAPGLYQLNLQVPSSLASGDHAVVAQYAGGSTQRGVLLAVER